MKNFDLERAKAGDPIFVVCGDEEKEAKFVAHLPEIKSIVLLIKGQDCVTSFNESGCNYWKTPCVFMAPKKRTVWVNIYRGWCHESEEGAKGNASHGCIKTIPVEIEE